jgi:hypothetical protein
VRAAVEHVGVSSGVGVCEHRAVAGRDSMVARAPPGVDVGGGKDPRSGDGARAVTAVTRVSEVWVIC